MDKKLRLKLAVEFGTEMEKNFPEYMPFKSKSVYIFPSESIWRKDTDTCNYFIILSPFPKGDRDEVTVELAWSTLKRFPELVMRPCFFNADGKGMERVAGEGSVRIRSLCEGTPEFMPVQLPTVSDVVALFMDQLKQNGMPFFDQVALAVAS